MKGDRMTTITPAEVTAEQARVLMADLLTAAKEHGVVTVITRHGKPVAQLGPITNEEESL
jgi:antitoxin (DNA-binding transcriptional repressor) of toxin-antitoxin stability system